jgi:hypothetical protein
MANNTAPQWTRTPIDDAHQHIRRAGEAGRTRALRLMLRLRCGISLFVSVNTIAVSMEHVANDSGHPGRLRATMKPEAQAHQGSAAVAKSVSPAVIR